MATLRTGQATDFSNQGTEFQVQSVSLDTAGEGITRYTPDFDKWMGYFKTIPEFRTVINKLASWTFGRGIKADEKNKAKLDKIKGYGKDSPRGVLKNQWKTALICGDSFAHIVRDNQGRMTNLKPLGNLTIVANSEGIIVGYEQGSEKKMYAPEDIYHMAYERIADEIHGTPFAEALVTIIIARNQMLADLQEMYHKTVFPTNIFESETDDTTKLNAQTATLNAAYKKHENIVIPAGVFKEIKRVSSPQYSGNDAGALDFMKFLVRQFVSSCGVPEVVMGWGEDTTEASSNIIYLAFQQEIEDMQLYNQEMMEIQLNIVVDLEFPASLEEKVKMNLSKRGEGTSLNPNKDG